MTHRVRTKNCEGCGAVFKATKYGKYCDKCKLEARKKQFPHKCEDCGAEFIGTKNTKLCRSCITKRMVAGRRATGSFYEETPESVENQIRKIKGVREKIIKYGECPNYNKDFVVCITCPVGAWKFKKCGTLKSDTDK